MQEIEENERLICAMCYGPRVINLILSTVLQCKEPTMYMH